MQVKFSEIVKNCALVCLITAIMFSLINIACSRTAKQLIGGFMFIGFMELIAFVGGIPLSWLIFRYGDRGR